MKKPQKTKGNKREGEGITIFSVVSHFGTIHRETQLERGEKKRGEINQERPVTGPTVMCA